MNLSQVEENLLVLLDPTGSTEREHWLFVGRDALPNEKAIPGEKNTHFENLVYCFTRRDLPHYFLYSLACCFGWRKGKTQKILFMHDGLLSCFFTTDKTACYRAYARKHLPAGNGFRSRIAKLLPLSWRAAMRFIVIWNKPFLEIPKHCRTLAGCNFMFYSNADGKLILTQGETFLTGYGQIVKTSATTEYAQSLENEYRILGEISKNLAKKDIVPQVWEKVTLRGKCFFAERYLCGENLREVLRALGRKKSSHAAESLLDRLDIWFRAYRTSFSGSERPLPSFIEPVLQSFATCHGHHPEAFPLALRAREISKLIGKDHRGLVPMIAHNDLWPGNFVVSNDHLTAIDWERATDQSAPIFDYYWMVISAVLEYRTGVNGEQDYSMSFRQFLDTCDDVCLHAHKMLGDFLAELGFERGQHLQFIMFFLLELSVQGYRTLGRMTDMDRLVFAELVAYAERLDDMPDGRFSRMKPEFIPDAVVSANVALLVP